MLTHFGLPHDHRAAVEPPMKKFSKSIFYRIISQKDDSKAESCLRPRDEITFMNGQSHLGKHQHIP